MVICGAGFGGLSAISRLTRAGLRVTLVDEHLYSTFQPLLYQVATGGLNPGDVAYPAGGSPFQSTLSTIAWITGLIVLARRRCQIEFDLRLPPRHRRIAELDRVALIVALAAASLVEGGIAVVLLF